MAYSTQRSVSDGTMAYLDISIEYMKREDISVFYNDLPADPSTWDWVGTTEKRIAFTPNVPAGTEVLIKRTTQIDEIINIFALGAKFNNSTMDINFTQLLYLNQEAVEGAALTDIFNDVDFHGYKIKNLGDAVNDNEAISFGQVKSMSTGAYSAQLAAEAARDKAQQWATQTPDPVESGNYSAKQYAANAAGSASAAAGSASAAAGSATAASGSAGSAASSKAAAEAAQAAAESARDDAQAAAAPATELIARVDAVEDVADAASAAASSAVTTAGAADTKASNALAGVRHRTGFDNLWGVTASGTQFTFGCERVWLKNAAGDVVSVVPSGDVTCISTTVGAGGRESAANFQNAWGYLHYIWNGTALNIVLSASRTAPTLPSGYTHWAFACPVRFGATANNVLVGFTMRKNIVSYTTSAILYSAGISSVAEPGNPLATTRLYLPPMKVQANLRGQFTLVTSSGNAAQVQVMLTPYTSAARYIHWVFRQAYPTAGVTLYTEAFGTIPVEHNVDIRIAVAMDEGSAQLSLSIASYEFSNGAM